MKQNNKITKEELNLIYTYLIDNVYENPLIMFDSIVRGDETNIDLIEIITDLYECLHNLILNEEYGYMFHWANKIGSSVDTGNFLSIIKNKESS